MSVSPIRLFVCRSVSSFVRWSANLFVCPSARLPVCLKANMSLSFKATLLKLGRQTYHCCTLYISRKNAHGIYTKRGYHRTYRQNLVNFQDIAFNIYYVYNMLLKFNLYRNTLLYEPHKKEVCRNAHIKIKYKGQRLYSVWIYVF